MKRMTVLVVDGYNAIYANSGTRKLLRKSLKSAREAILALSKEYARTSGYINEVKVVFDGDDRYRHMDGTDPARSKAEVFSNTGGGDDKIIRTAKFYARRGKVVVASNDNYVRNNARAYGAGLIDVRELVQGRKKRKDPPGEDERISKAERDDITRAYREELGI